MQLFRVHIEPIEHIDTDQIYIQEKDKNTKNGIFYFGSFPNFGNFYICLIFEFGSVLKLGHFLIWVIFEFGSFSKFGSFSNLGFSNFGHFWIWVIFEIKPFLNLGHFLNLIYFVIFFVFFWFVLSLLYLCPFLDTQVSLAPTHESWLVGWLVGWSVRWLVRHTFGFPISGQ